MRFPAWAGRGWCTQLFTVCLCCWKLSRRRLTAWGTRALPAQRRRGAASSPALGPRPRQPRGPGARGSSRSPIAHSSSSPQTFPPLLPNNGLNPVVYQRNWGKGVKSSQGALRAVFAPGFWVYSFPSPGVSSPARVSKAHHSCDSEMLLPADSSSQAHLPLPTMPDGLPLAPPPGEPLH